MSLFRQLSRRDRQQIAIRVAGFFSDVVEIFIGEYHKNIWSLLIEVRSGDDRDVSSRRELVLLQRAIVDRERDQRWSYSTVVANRRHARGGTIAGHLLI